MEDRGTAQAEWAVEFTLPGVQADDVIAALKDAAAELSGDTDSDWTQHLGPVRIVRTPSGSVCHVGIPVMKRLRLVAEEEGRHWQGTHECRGKLVFTLAPDAGDSLYVAARAEGDEGQNLRPRVLRALALRFRDPAVQRVLVDARAEALACCLPAFEVEAAPEPGETPLEPPSVVPFEQAPEIVRDTSRMHAHYRDYSASTALAILQALPGARVDHEYGYDNTARVWGPGRIANHMKQSGSRDLRPETVHRYLKAWWLSGLRVVEIDGESIPIPYHPRGPSK